MKTFVVNMLVLPHLKKATNRFIKVVFDIEKSLGFQFNKKNAKDMAFQKALDNAKDGNEYGALILFSVFNKTITDMGEELGCKKLLNRQVNNVNQKSGRWEQKNNIPKKERKRDF